MHRLIPAPALWPVIAMLLLAGCRVPQPGSPADTVYKCGSELVQKCWPQSLAGVNGCLSMPDGENWASCLTGLIGPTACAAESVIACLVRDSGMKAAASAKANAYDVRSERVANRAAEYISYRGWRFVD